MEDEDAPDDGVDCGIAGRGVVTLGGRVCGAAGVGVVTPEDVAPAGALPFIGGEGGMFPCGNVAPGVSGGMTPDLVSGFTVLGGGGVAIVPERPLQSSDTARSLEVVLPSDMPRFAQSF